MNKEIYDSESSDFKRGFMWGKQEMLTKIKNIIKKSPDRHNIVMIEFKKKVQELKK